MQVFYQMVPVQHLSTCGVATHLGHQIPNPVMPVAQAGERGCQRLLIDPLGELIVLKRPKKDTDYTEFSPCHACKGFVLKSDLWRHARRCPLIEMSDACPRNDVLVDMSRMLLKKDVQAEQDELFGDILRHMRNDSIRDIVEADPLLRHLGCYMLQNKGKTGSLLDHIKNRLRSLSKLLQSVRDHVDNGQLSLKDMLQPRYFDAVISSVHKVCTWQLGDCNNPPSFKIPSLALKLGHALKKSTEPST